MHNILKCNILHRYKDYVGFKVEFEAYFWFDSGLLGFVCMCFYFLFFAICTFASAMLDYIEKIICVFVPILPKTVD